MMHICLGQTPQRREFSYPRNLTKTEEHQTLLTRFQENYQLRKDPFPLHLTPVSEDDLAAFALLNYSGTNAVTPQSFGQVSNGHIAG